MCPSFSWAFLAAIPLFYVHSWWRIVWNTVYTKHYYWGLYNGLGIY